MDGLKTSDWFMVAADFDAYAAAQRDVDDRWRGRKIHVGYPQGEHVAASVAVPLE